MKTTSNKQKFAAVVRFALIAITIYIIVFPLNDLRPDLRRYGYVALSGLIVFGMFVIGLILDFAISAMVDDD